ncbi:MAG: hypothetical protein HY591_03820 [Candidatus Omnitrophica bacterium]|nr:hypothetical protein [Candidatus Omnitrophota bacterium]
MDRTIGMITGVLLVFFVWFGLVRASHQELWNDESYSLVSSIMGRSYGRMLVGDMGGVEGNNTPLFYVLQKLQCDVFSYHMPQAWVDGKWDREDIFSQVFLRVQPVLFIALSLSALFYYFAVRYSLTVGFYSVMVALSSFMLWAHWTEARPYALLFFLTTAQILLLLELLRGTPSGHKVWGWLALVHCLLALTTSVSALQIVACSVVLWSFSCRQWQRYLAMTVLPVSICLFYYFTFPNVSNFIFHFVDGPVALISANIPKDRFFIIFIFALFFWGRRWQAKDRNPIALEGKYIVFLGLMLLAYAAVLVRFKAMEPANGYQGFQVPARYFMSLTPAGIVATTLFSVWLVRASDPKFVRPAVVLGLIVFLTFRLHRTSEVFHWGLPL